MYLPCLVIQMGSALLTSARRLLAAALMVAMTTSGGAYGQTTDPALEAERTRLQQEEQRLADERTQLDADKAELAAQQSQQTADNEAAQATQKEEIDRQQAELDEQRQQLEADRTAFEESQRQQAETPAATTDPAPSTEPADTGPPTEDTQTESGNPSESAGDGNTNGTNTDTSSQAAPRPGDTGAQQEEPEPIPIPDVNPPRRVIEINASTVLGGELSELWSIFKGRNPELGLNDLGHATNTADGTSYVGGSRIDSLPSEWAAELMAIAQEQGYNSDNPDAPFLVAPEGGAAQVVGAESERFQAESNARSDAERQQADQDRAQQEGNGTGTEGGDNGPTDVASTGGTGNDSNSSEDVPDLAGDGSGADGTNSSGTGSDTSSTGSTTGTSGDTGSDGSNPSAPGDSTTGTSGTNTEGGQPQPGGPTEGAIPDSEIPQNLLDRNVRLSAPISADRMADLNKALGFVPRNALRGKDGEGIVMFYEDNDSPDSPTTAAQWEYSGSGPARIRVYALQQRVEDRAHVIVHEMMHQALTLTSPDGEERINAAFEALSPEDQEKALPSRYAASDPTPEKFERPTEIIAFYLQNKNSEFSGNPYKEDVPPALKAVLDELIAEWQ